MHGVSSSDFIRYVATFPNVALPLRGRDLSLCLPCRRLSRAFDYAETSDGDITSSALLYHDMIYGDGLIDPPKLSPKRSGDMFLDP